MNNVSRFVLTGGPCGGKTSCLAYLEQELALRGVKAVIVPEAARMFIRGGVHPPHIPPIEFQDLILRSVISQEGLFIAAAGRMDCERAVVLCDRGTMDSKAYLEPLAFEALLSRNGWNVPTLRDARYDAVIHLVTAADGAEEHYVVDDERFETPELARERDRATQAAWMGHAHFKAVDNSTDFDGKKKRVLAYILHQLGMPVPLEIERKFRLDEPRWNDLPPDAVCVHIEQAYLRSNDAAVEERVRKRSQDGHAVYYRTLKRTLRSGVREEREWSISEDEYDEALRQRDPERGVIRKNRWCFQYEHQYFELDDFRPMGKIQFLLEIELTEEHASVTLPPWLTVLEDVTGDAAYSNYEIAALNAA